MHANPAVVVVPPFECAWLTNPDCVLQNGKGCLTFEVRGDNDVTVLFKRQPGSRRWQHLSAATGSDPENNYTVILGSHRNSCLKIEKDGILCCTVNDAAVSRLPSKAFIRCWINYDAGCISVGVGEPGTNTSHTWKDPSPIDSISYVGLSAWDTHVVYRAIRMLPALPTPAQPSGAKATPLPSLVELSSQRLHESLHPGSIAAVLTALDALEPMLPSLRHAALSYAAEHLDRALDLDPGGVAGLPAAMLAEILQSQAMSCEEVRVFEAVALWAAAHGGGADLAPDLNNLLPHVRFPLMTRAELDEVSRHALCEHSALLRDLVVEARAADSVGAPDGPLGSLLARRTPQVPSRLEAALSARFLSRTTPGCTELLFVRAGDRNGVAHWLATQGGQQQWVNPMLSGRVRVQASSPSCRSTNPASCVALGPPRLNFAAPRSEGGGLAAWWALDLGPRHRLACSAYTLRHDTSRDPLRTWTLQARRRGSHGGHGGWEDLRQHVDDTTLRLPGQYGSWAVTGHSATVPYRAFRICLSQPQRGNDNPWHASLAQLDLYGNLYHVAGEGG